MKWKYEVYENAGWFSMVETKRDDIHSLFANTRVDGFDMMGEGGGGGECWD